MSFSQKFVRIARNLLPSPFTIALLLTALTALLALVLTLPSNTHILSYSLEVVGFWEKGFWELLTFAMQMMLMLVLGHALALTKPVDNFINHAIGFCTSTAKAAFFVSLLTISVAFINWGLGLIFGAVFARKVGEFALQKNIPLNYPLIGAAAYSGLMVWHGGLSGSAPLKVAEAGNKWSEQIAGVYGSGFIPISETLFSGMNLFATVLILVIIPSAMYWLGKRSTAAPYQLSGTYTSEENTATNLTGAERLDHAKLLAFIFGGIMLAFGIYKGYDAVSHGKGLAFINPNYINLMLFGMGLLLHSSVAKFLKAINEAISGASGIMIQFPLYAGIMGIMKYSGLVNVFSDFFVSISTPFTFPLFTLISAGIVNVFVPSGGGQWAVQGPIIIEAAKAIGVSLPKCIMALAYGDQLTNMMQPFWALPLLGITGLKAKDILPYTLFLLLLGFCIFMLALMLF